MTHVKMLPRNVVIFVTILGEIENFARRFHSPPDKKFILQTRKTVLRTTTQMNHSINHKLNGSVFLPQGKFPSLSAMHVLE